jgi:hypothetical protein
MTSGLNKNWKRASTRQYTITYPYSVDRAEAIGITDRASDKATPRRRGLGRRFNHMLEANRTEVTVDNASPSGP